MIPKNITKDEITRAVKTIDADGIPKSREFTRYNLLYMVARNATIFCED